MIHRERYDDWSWPKGKINPGETMPECATREVLEEIGLDITLGIPLPAMRYEVNSGPKVVYYWAARSPAPRRYQTARKLMRCVGPPQNWRARG